LIREPENAYDPAAIAVAFGALRLGYLRREIAQRLAPHLDAGRRYEVWVTARTGGGDRRLGVNIEVARLDAPAEARGSVAPVGGIIAERDAIVTALIGDRRLHEAQHDVIERVLAERRTVAVLGTGRGKSLCFQVPAALLAAREGAKTLVLYPLRALVNDQYEALQRRLAPLGLRILRATGAIEPEEREALMQALESGAWDVLLSTPEFVQHHLPRLLREASRPSFIVLDEAHHIVEARHRAAYSGVPQMVARLAPTRLLALTATARNDVFERLVDALSMTAWVIDPTVRENLSVVDARGTVDRVAAIRRIVGEHGKAIVYGNSRREVTHLAEQLRESFPATAFYHAGVGSAERLEIERRFREDEIRLVVATSAFGEGIDLPDVRDVVLYHLNFHLTAFNQQAGRAGRDGAPARIHLLYGQRDRRINELLLSRSAPEVATLRSIYRGLRGLAGEDATIHLPATEIARILDIDRVDEVTMRTAIAIFTDIGLLTRQEDEEEGGRSLRLLPPSGRVDPHDSPRYLEGLAERESFAAFCDLALGAAAADLERVINRPIYPSGVPLLN